MTTPTGRPAHRFAVLADPHYFDLFPDYAMDGVEVGGRRGAAVHTLADSAISTRLFNEGYFALPAALDQCAAHGLRTIVIAGDLSDDGQQSAMAGAVALLRQYEARHGMRFFLTPGNHDAHGMSGRDITRRLLNADGSFTTVSSADAASQAGLTGPYLQTAGQRCGTYPALLEQWHDFGLMRRPEDCHWESPFGSDDAPASRYFTLYSPDGKSEHRQLDLSYLVEPEEGLWLLSIDANIYAPRNGYQHNDQPEAFEDSTGAGWPALVRHKPFLLDWMADVARRADALGKTLICFSHYPMVDPLDGTSAFESALMGDTMSVRRTPSAEVSRRLCATGIASHFSGHMHIYDRAGVEAEGNRLTNYAMPSLVAFPGVFAIGEASGRALSLHLERLELDTHSALFPAYRTEMAELGDMTDWLEAGTYSHYLLAQIGEQVKRRQLPGEWPEPLGAFLRRARLADVLAMLDGSDSNEALPPEAIAAPLEHFMIDLHALRMGSEIALDELPAARLETYRQVAALVGRGVMPTDGIGGQLKLLMAMFERFSTPNHALAWTRRGG